MDGRSPSPPLESEILARLLRDDESAIQDLVRAYGPTISCALSQKYKGCQSREDLEDVLAIALFRLWQNRRRFDSTKASLRTWFYCIAENVIQDVLRSGWHKARRREAPLPDLSLLQQPTVSQLDERSQPATPNGTSRDLQAILDKLPSAQRHIVLADANAPEGLANSADLASELGLSTSTVRVYRKRALEAIRRELSKRGYQIPSE